MHQQPIYYTYKIKEANRETDDKNAYQTCYETKKLGNQWGEVTDSPRTCSLSFVISCIFRYRQPGISYKL